MGPFAFALFPPSTCSVPAVETVPAFSEDVRTGGGSVYLDDYDSDDDPASRAIENLNASIMGSAVRMTPATAAAVAAAPSGGPDARERSFSVGL